MTKNLKTAGETAKLDKNTIRFYLSNSKVGVFPKSGNSWSLSDFHSMCDILYNGRLCADDNNRLHFEYHNPDFDGVIRITPNDSAYYSVSVINIKTGKHSGILADVPAKLFTKIYNENRNIWF